MTETDIVNYLYQDVKDMGGNIVEICQVFKWDYFPHFAPKDLESGIYQKLMNFQGKRSTFYLGSIFNFELVECNIAFTKHLIQTHFGDKSEIAQEKTSGRKFKENSSVDASTLTEVELLQYMRETIAIQLELDISKVTANTGMTQLGLDSLRAIQLASALTERFQYQFAPSILFEYPTIAQFAHYFYTELQKYGAAAQTSYTSTEDIIYNEIDGSMFVLGTKFHRKLAENSLSDVYEPIASRNGYAILDIVSAGWFSNKLIVRNHTLQGVWHTFCSRGFTVFAIRHGNVGRWHIEDMMDNLKAAVNYVRKHAAKYKVTMPDNLGLLGGSAGGHLALQLGCNTAQVAPYIDCIAAFCPPSDATTFDSALKQKLFQVFDEKNYSPLHYLNSSEKYPSTIFFHAERDPIAPIENTRKIAEIMKQGGNTVELISVDSDQHEWSGMHNSMAEAADWMLQQMREVTSGKVLKHVHRRSFDCKFNIPPIVSQNINNEKYDRYIRNGYLNIKRNLKENLK